MHTVFDDATVVGVGGTTLETILAVSQANEILQAIQIGLSILTFLVTLFYTLWKWYKRVTDEKSDEGKKITKKEVDELKKEIKDEVDKHDRD